MPYTPEERKIAHREASKRFRQRHHERVKAAEKDYRQRHLQARRAYNAAYRLTPAQKEHKKVVDRLYHVSHREKLLQQKRAYYLAHREEILAKDRQRNKTESRRASKRQANRTQERQEAERARAKERRKTRQQDPAMLCLYAARRRALKLNAPLNDLTHAQWMSIQAAQDHRCAYCGKRCKGHLTQDHIQPLSKGGSHTLHNVIGACQSCNSRKHTGPPLAPVQPLLL